MVSKPMSSVFLYGIIIGGCPFQRTVNPSALFRKEVATWSVTINPHQIAPSGVSIQQKVLACRIRRINDVAFGIRVRDTAKVRNAKY